MELRQTEALRMLDDHDGRVGHVDPDLDYRRSNEHRNLTVTKCSHGRLALLGFHPAVHQTDLEWAQILPQPLRHCRGGLEIDLLRFFDHRIDDVHLPSGSALFGNKRINGAAILTAADGRAHCLPARRFLFDDRDIEVAIQRERQRPRNWRRRQQQDVGRLSLLDQRSPLFDAKAMLFVDYDESQQVEPCLFLKQGVRPHDDAGHAGGNPIPNGRLFGCREAADEQFGHDAERCKESRQRRGMLLGEQLSGRHEHGLAVVLHCEKHRKERHDGLA